MMNTAVESRTVVPPLPPRYMPRERLLQALDDDRGAALTLVAAGPGSGKTVLLRDWAATRARRAPTAWLSLTAGDDTPRRFWRLFLAALRASGTTQTDLPPALPGATDELLDSLFLQVPE